MMRKTIVLAAALALASSCIAPHAKRYFEFELPAPASGGPAFDRVLVLDRIVISDLYDDFRIIYRLSPTEVNYYAYDFWAEKPSRLILNALHRRLSAAGLFRRVGLEMTTDTPDWIFRTQIMRVEEIDAREIWSARLALVFEVTDFATGRTIAARSFDRSEPLDRKDVALLPAVLSRILAEELEAFLADLAARSGSR